MTTRFALLSLVVLPLLVGCSSSSRGDEDSSTGTSEGAFSSSFKPVVRCEGAHIDMSNPEAEGDNQLVISDQGAADWLQNHLSDAMAHDPFSQWGLQPAWGVKHGQAHEIVWHMSGFNQFVAEPRQDFIASFSLTSGNEIRADVTKHTWDQDAGNGTFRKVTDLTVRIVRNGYQEVILQHGVSGDPDTYVNTGRGWNEWEIANWTFRGCSNL